MELKTREVARLLLNEVPLAEISKLVGPQIGREAMGDGCGGGCGGGAGCIDRDGLTGITNVEVKAAIADRDSLRAALAEGIKPYKF